MLCALAHREGHSPGLNRWNSIEITPMLRRSNARRLVNSPALSACLIPDGQLSVYAN